MLYTKEQTEKIKDFHFAYLQMEEKDHVLTLTLNRPKKKNALNEILNKEIAFALTYAHFQPAVWAVVIKANGNVWCAGADLAYFAGEKDLDSGSTVPEPAGEVIYGDLLKGLHKPCIAAVHASCFAGAFLLLCGCTHVVAVEDATFSLTEVKRGIWPMQVMASLLPIVPSRQVLDLCIRGRELSAQEACELGIVTQIAPPGGLEAVVDCLLQEITANSPAAIRLGLKAYQEMQSISRDDQHSWLFQQLKQILRTEDAKEGIAAFREKRPPNWTGN
ncbi:MAG: enoyl-CoA hydratase/isomerase family protein [Bacteroidia bacterium]|nr:enoyl-CoA hydratase/isomerase family protein [Bacteroidia bacterium]